jgi:4-amino-4-deoxy-L-arabinose transferase-like glycosyltransferase
LISPPAALADDDVAPLAWRPVIAIAGVAVLLLVVTASRYGWHRDELYFLEAGKHLAWGYVDQPPFTPFVARIADEVAPGNLVVLRIAPMLSTALLVVVGALIAREMGGQRFAQVMAAAAVAFGGFALGVGHLLATAAFDIAAWMALLWIFLRILRTADPRWWLAFGAVAGVAMLNKNLVVLLGLALAFGLVAARRRDVASLRWLGAGGGVAVLIALPNLVWQSQHDWPQLHMAEALNERLAAENRATLLPLQLLFNGPALVYALWRGARWLARASEATPFRAALWAWPAGLVITFATGGRPYYCLALATTVVIAGIVAIERAGSRRALVWCVALNALVSVPAALPLLPVTTLPTTHLDTLNEAVAETVGWPQLVDQVAGVVQALPTSEQHDVILLTGSYGEAGAIDRFGPARGLPHAYSPHNSYPYFRQPTNDGATVVAVRMSMGELAPLFDQCAQVATVDNGVDVQNEVQGTPILVCRGLKGTWRDLWPRLRKLS